MFDQLAQRVIGDRPRFFSGTAFLSKNGLSKNVVCPLLLLVDTIGKDVLSSFREHEFWKIWRFYFEILMSISWRITCYGCRVCVAPCHGPPGGTSVTAAPPGGTSVTAAPPGGTSVTVAPPGGTSVTAAPPGGTSVTATPPGGTSVTAAPPGGTSVTAAPPGGTSVTAAPPGGTSVTAAPPGGTTLNMQ